MTAIGWQSRVTLCPRCGYDCTGLGTPICPECGVDVVVEERRRLRALEFRRRRRRWLVTDILLLLAALYATFNPFHPPHYSLNHFINFPPGVVCSLALALIWLWLRRKQVVVEGRLRHAVPYVAVFCWAAWLQLGPRHWYRYDLDAAARWIMLGSGMLLVVWAVTRGRVLWILLFMIGLMLAISGLTISSLTDWTTPGDQWSHFSDPRPGQVHDQYPLRWDEARWLGPSVALTGTALTMIGGTLRIASSRRVRRGSHPSRALIMSRTPQTDAMWNEFKAATGPAADSYVVVTFGSKPETRDALADLALQGVKRATTSMKLDFGRPGADPFPSAGDFVVVVDGSNAPRCVYRVTRVDVKPFRDVDAAFARDEGEGDRTLEDWVRGHRAFFVQQGVEEGFEFHDGMDVVLERFEVVWPTDQ